MRILLSSANFCNSPYVVYPLGIGVLASALSQAGHEVCQFDPLSLGDYQAQARALLQDFRPELIGVSIRNLDDIDSRQITDRLLGESLDVIRFFRAEAPGVPMVLGGPGFSLYAEDILRLTGVEYGISGEGEDAIVQLADSLAAGKPLRPGVLHLPNTTLAGAIYDGAIADFYNAETHLIPVQTKRGCPFRCVYCTYPVLEGRKIRTRDPDNVLADLADIHARWPDAMVYFVDSVFNDPSGHYKKLLEAMLSNGLNLPWTGFITPASLTESDIRLMVDAGLVAADLGVDAATDQTLAGIGKNFSFADVQRCCRQLLEQGVFVTTNVMFGGPGETDATVQQGIANLLSLEPAYSVIFAGIRLFHGAPLIETARQQGKIPADWNGIGALYYFAPGIDPERLHEMLLEGFQNSRYCIYPPASRNHDIQMIHKFGFLKLRNLRLGKK